MKKVSVFVSVAALALLMGVVRCNTHKKSAENSSSADSSLAPDVTFKDLQDKDVTLASLRGKVVLLNFWATWCEPCQIEIPWIIDMQQKYATRGFTVVGAAMDDEGKKVVEPFVRDKDFDVNGVKMHMNYPIVIGNDEIAQKFGGILGLPTSVLISRDGKIVDKHLGLIMQDQLEKEIKGQL